MYKEAIQDAISMHELPSKWNSDVLNEAKTAANKKKIARYRKDLRKLNFATIDGEDAKDFDDAVYCVKNSNSFTLYVAIADVSFYVTPGSKIDIEAKKRGTSIYFPETVIPMLPENLSNGICSLRPNEDRCSMICEMSIGLDGKRNKYKFYSGLINSKARLTYNQVEKHLNKSSSIKQAGVRDSIKHLKDLTNLRLKLRNQRKALEISPMETTLELSESKEVKNIVLKKSLFAHKLVEQSMLLANESAAEFMQERLNLGVYRIHEDPEESKINELKNYIKQFGYTINTNEGNLSNSLNGLMKEIKGKPEERSIEKFAIRSMSKAIYSTKKEKHFGLSFKHYTHFTSPIRRFPDVMVHRLLSDYMNESKPKEKTYYDIMCKHSSKMEINASKAERESIKYKQAEFMSMFIGKKFEAVISGVTEWGVYAEIVETLCEGLIKISSMKDDHYVFDSEKMRITGRNNKKIFRLGQSIRVKVIDTDIEKRTIDLELS